MKAKLSNFRQPPRKVRLLAKQLKGKTVPSALIELDFFGRKASQPIKKLIDSAVANAIKDSGREKDNLYIKNIRIDKGLVMKRYLPRAQGRATLLRHRTSHIAVELAVLEKLNQSKSTEPETNPPKAAAKA